MSSHALRSALAISALAVAGALLPLFGSDVLAQGVTTVAIRGSVLSADATEVDGARVEVLNTATGFAVEGVVRHGRFLIQGLEVGGPYTVAIERPGSLPERRDALFLTLGEPLELAFQLQPAPIPVDTLRVAVPSFPRINAPGGPATTIPDSLIHRLPTLNRNFHDFVVLAPQVSTKIGFQRSGVSGAGANLRFNSFLINGAEERAVNGSVSAASNLGKSIPIDAVKEYQVLVAPYDVRYGDFAGALVNSVTKSGTNELEGSAFAFWRNDRLGRGGELAPSQPYERLQYGFTLGGPILRDRLHFFIAPEFQHLSSPAPGPYVGQPPTASPTVPVAEEDVARVERILRGYGLSAGSPGRVETETPLRNFFARLDASIPSWKSRALGFMTYARRDDDVFSRSAPDTFSLSTYRWTPSVGLRLIAVQFTPTWDRAAATTRSWYLTAPTGRTFSRTSASRSSEFSSRARAEASSRSTRARRNRPRDDSDAPGPFTSRMSSASLWERTTCCWQASRRSDFAARVVVWSARTARGRSPAWIRSSRARPRRSRFAGTSGAQACR